MILETLTAIIIITSTQKTITGPIDPNPLHITFTPSEQYFIDNVHYMTSIHWYHGCSPTAVGMVFSYWDRLGYDILPGDFQTEITLRAMIASPEHYDDYSTPIDWYNIQPDKSELPLGDEHINNSIADMMGTSQSAKHLTYGQTWISNIGIGTQNWILSRGYTPTLMAHYRVDYSDDEFWNLYTSEINDNRPIILNIFTSSGLHTVAGIGYGYDGNERLYAVYNTWSKSIIWYKWGKYGKSYSPMGFYTLDIEGEIKPPMIWSVYLPIIFN